MGLPPGTYSIAASRIGYALGTVEQVSITSGTISSVDFLLAPTTLALQDAAVVRDLGGSSTPLPLIIVDR